MLRGLSEGCCSDFEQCASLPDARRMTLATERNIAYFLKPEAVLFLNACRPYREVYIVVSRTVAFPASEDYCSLI